MYNHILLSTDGSELARKGIDHGLALAKRLGSKVTIVTVTESFPATGIASELGWVAAPVDFDRYDAAQKELAQRILGEAAAAAEKAEVAAETVHVPNAWPAGAIVNTATERGCDLIVMASHGRRGLEKVLIGSQTSEVLVTATVPVLVVR
ncbi:MAG TPA: universal stress protein [Pararhizobium sp.]|nr:universal stress protein [Pararhizobium sp.]